DSEIPFLTASAPNPIVSFYAESAITPRQDDWAFDARSDFNPTLIVSGATNLPTSTDEAFGWVPTHYLDPVTGFSAYTSGAASTEPIAVIAAIPEAGAGNPA